MEFFASCFICVAQCFSIVLGLSYKPRALQGWVDTDNNYPYVVSLQTNQTELKKGLLPRCTGSLITEIWVLTAAHCLVAHLTIIRYGDTTVPADIDSLVTVLKRFPHPNYALGVGKSSNIVKNDIGLILLSKAISMKRLGKLSVLDYKSLVGLPVNYAGYSMYMVGSQGELDKNIKLLAKTPLQVGEGVIKECSKEDTRFWYPAICISQKCRNKNGHSASGDTGGPLLFKNKIIGVYSGGIYESKFTPVSPYVDWISNVMFTALM